MNPNKENCMLVDIQYVKPDRRNNIPDYLYIIWKNLDTMEKHLQVVPEPKMDIFFEKTEFQNHDYNLNYQHIEKLDKYTVKYDDIPKIIASHAGPKGKEFLYNAYKTKNYQAIKQMYLYPYTFGSDYDVASWYRIQWIRKLNNNRPKILTKGFLDIEADGIEVNDMPDPVSCPINAVTIIDGYKKDVYTFIYIDRPCVERNMELMNENEKKKELERRAMYEHMHKEQHELLDNQEDFIKELHEMFDPSYGELDYHLYFYNDEKKMLVHLFQLINTLKLDIIGIWNMSFDIPYIRDRMIALGLDPKELFTHPDFPSKSYYFKEDTRNHDIKNKSDTFSCTSYTTFYDQMELYAHIRKSGSELRTVRLTDIGKKELQDEKLDYSDDGNIKTLPYINFRKFIAYNIKDVLLQYGIENRTFDFNTLYARSYLNATQFNKVFSQTVVLRNAEYLSFLQQGLIPGNNTNILNTNDNEKLYSDDDDDDEGYEGALVADPTYNGHVGQPLLGKITNNVFLHAIDFDMSAFYPYSLISNNIDQSTLIFKVILPMQQYDILGGKIPFRGITAKEFIPKVTTPMSDTIKNPKKKFKLSTKPEDVEGGKECIDNFQTRNYMSFGTKWMNMPDVNQVYQRLKNKLG